MSRLRHRGVISKGIGGVALTPAQEFTRREALTFGTYKPDDSNTGTLQDPSSLPSTAGNVTLSTNGQILQDTIVNGTVTINAANCVVKNCWIRGVSAGSTGQLVACLNSTTLLNATITDCLIVPQTPIISLDGIKGWQFTAKRCRIYYTLDGLGCFCPSALVAQGQRDIGVSILGNWVSDLSKWYPEAGHVDGTHNDCVQHQGGSNVVIRGNRFEGMIAQDAGAGNTGGVNTVSGGGGYVPENRQINSGIILNANATQPLNTIIDRNWIYGASTAINGRQNTLIGNIATITDNKFDHTQYFPGGHAPTSNTTACVSIESAATITTSGNVYEDNGVAVQIVRTND